MGKTGKKYRDPYVIEARRRKAGPIESSKRKLVEELIQKELDEELEHAWQSIPCEKQWHFTPGVSHPIFCECGVETAAHGGLI